MENMHLSIFDYNGRLVKDIDKGQKVGGDYNYQIDLSSFQNGVHIVHLVTTKSKQSVQILKNDANTSGSDSFTN